MVQHLSSIRGTGRLVQVQMKRLQKDGGDERLWQHIEQGQARTLVTLGRCWLQISLLHMG